MLEHVISGLAILKVNWDTNRDYIDSFVPFVADCLRASERDEVTLIEVQRAIIDTFGLRIPQGALKTILKRVARADLVRLENGIYHRNFARLGEFDISAHRAQASRQCEALIKKLIDYSKNQFQVNWPREEAEVALLSFVEKHSIPILSAVVDNQPIIAPVNPTQQSEYIVGNFIKNLSEEDPDGFYFLETVVKGGMLANGLILPEIGKVSKKLDGIEVYLDTKFVIRLLGLSGEGLQEPCLELIRLLNKNMVPLRIFDHTFEEIKGVLIYTSRALKDFGYIRQTSGETIEYCIRKRKTSSDIEQVISTLEYELSKLNVHVRRKPKFETSLSINELKLEAMLKEKIGYSREEALRKDVESLAAIHRLRKGQFFSGIESCKAIFVTTNNALAEVSSNFFREEYGQDIAPYCVLDYFFSTIVWLKDPMSAPELPRKRIISDCFAALNPPDNVWRMYLGKINDLQNGGAISEEEYYSLRFSMEARNVLMNVTLGEPDAFTEGTITEVLEKAKAFARAEVEANLLDEKEKRQEAEYEIAKIRDSLVEKNQRRAESIKELSSRLSRNICKTIRIGITAVLVFGAIFSLPSQYSYVPESLPLKYRYIPVVVFSLIALVSVISGVSLKSTMISFEGRLASAIERTIKEVFSRFDGE